MNPPDSTLTRWATKQEIAEAKRLSVRTIESLMREGLPHFKLRHRVCFCPVAVDHWFEQNFKVN